MFSWRATLLAETAVVAGNAGCGFAVQSARARRPRDSRRGRRRYFALRGLRGAAKARKKTGLVGPASSASSWMRLHRSAARLVLRVLFWLG